MQRPVAPCGSDIEPCCDGVFCEALGVAAMGGLKYSALQSSTSSAAFISGSRLAAAPRPAVGLTMTAIRVTGVAVACLEQALLG